MLAIIPHYPTGPKEESETGEPRTKAVLVELQTWGKTDKAYRHGQRDYQTQGGSGTPAGHVLVGTEDRTATMYYSSLCPL